MTCKGMLFIELLFIEGTSHGHNFHVFLWKTYSITYSELRKEHDKGNKKLALKSMGLY